MESAEPTESNRWPRTVLHGGTERVTAAQLQHCTLWQHAMRPRAPSQLHATGQRGLPHLIQHQDAGVFEDGTREGDALLLAPAQAQAALPHARLKPVREVVHNRPMQRGRLGAGLHLLIRGAGPPIPATIPPSWTVCNALMLVIRQTKPCISPDSMQPLRRGL